jgi:hypothetical protein
MCVAVVTLVVMDAAVGGLEDLDLVAAWYELAESRSQGGPDGEKDYQILTVEMKRRQLLARAENGRLVLATIPPFEATSHKQYIAIPVLLVLAVQLLGGPVRRRRSAALPRRVAVIMYAPRSE